MAQDTYKVYARIDGAGNIIEPPNSSAFLSDITGWTEIDEGTGDKYHHAQGNYFPVGLTTEDGIFRYCWDGTQVVIWAEEEIAADRAALPEPEPSAEDTALDMLADHEYRLCMIELGA